MLRIAGVLAVFIAAAGTARGQAVERPFTLATGGEVVAAITAGCEGCSWGAAGREAVALRLSLDGGYSQHLLLVRGEAPVEYRVMLGALAAGSHQLTIERDAALSAKEAGSTRIESIVIESFSPGSAEHAWLATAPFLRARPGTIERFSDVPLMMYTEAASANTGYEYTHTVIFSHEDGGTPTDRLMATWGRSTDIEFVYGVKGAAENGPPGEYQGPHHEIMPFRGRREGDHPILWVSTENNMVSDTGDEGAVRFAPAPALVSLADVSREAVMDANPWLYEVMAAELAREGRIDPAAGPGSGKIPNPRRFAYVEGCGDLSDATLAFDVGVRDGAAVGWYETDRGDARFRIARNGCFRAAVPVPDGTTPESIVEVRARAYTRPPREGESPLPAHTGRVVLKRVNTVFMLRDDYTPVPSPVHWTGTLQLTGESPAATLPGSAR